MKDLKRRVGAAILLITHDLGVVAEVAERVIVMYPAARWRRLPSRSSSARRGIPIRKVCLARCRSSAPRSLETITRLAEIPGLVPSLTRRIEGCVFASRLPRSRPISAGRSLRRSRRKRSGTLPPATMLPKTRWRHERPTRGQRSQEAFSRAQRSVGHGHHLEPRGGRRLVSRQPRRDAGAGRRGSGCGKSTVGRAILRLFDITAGQVVLDGQRIADLSPGALPAAAPARAGDIPGPVLEPQSAHARALHSRRADAELRARRIDQRHGCADRRAHGQGAAAARRGEPLAARVLRRPNASASGSPGRSLPNPTSSCATKQCRRSTSRSRRRS